MDEKNTDENYLSRLFKLERDINALYKLYVNFYQVYQSKEIKFMVLNIGDILGKTYEEVKQDLKEE